MDEFLEKHPELRVLSQSKLVAALRGQFTRSQIIAYMTPREITQIYAKPKQTAPLKITAPPYSFQIDIAKMPAYKNANKGTTEMLLLVDILSRKAFAYPLRNGKMETVLIAYNKFLREVEEDEGGPVNSVEGDNFFKNKSFMNINDEQQINLYTDVAKDDHVTKTGNKLGIVDRFTRTIKNYIQKYMLLHKTLQWTSFLPQLIELYNDTPHTSLKDNSPNEVWADQDYMEIQNKNDIKSNEKSNKSFNLPDGTSVRIMVGKELFEKEKARFSTEIYTVVDQVGYRFKLQNENGEPVKRLYRAGELLKVTQAIDRVRDKPAEARRAHKDGARISKEMRRIS